MYIKFSRQQEHASLSTVTVCRVTYCSSHTRHKLLLQNDVTSAGPLHGLGRSQLHTFTNFKFKLETYFSSLHLPTNQRI
jgi:hypothetical protein